MYLAGLFAGLLLCSPVPDLIHLKRGGTVEGKILEENATSVVIQTRMGKVKIERSRILKLEHCPWVVEEFKQMWSRVDRKDKVALSKLLDWCQQPDREKKLKTEARKVARRILRLDDKHVLAHKVMGHVKYKGRWVSRQEAKKLAEQIARATAEEKAKAAAEVARRQEELVRLKLIGGVSIAKQVQANRKQDLAEERLLRDQHALDFIVRSSRRISVKGVLDEALMLHFLKLGETMCGTLNKELGLPLASSPFKTGQDKKIHFFVVKAAHFSDTLRYVNGTYTNYPPQFLQYSLKRQSGVTADGDGCVGIQIDGMEHNEDVFCHYFGHAYVESIGRRVGHWFTEGFAVYCAIRFHGKAVHLCTTQQKYAENPGEEERKDVAIQMGFLERAKKKILPSVRGLFKKHMNTLAEADLAKSWGTVSFFMEKKNRKMFLKYLQTMPLVGGKHEEALKKVFKWTPEKLDQKVMDYRPAL